jgi:hypothetical protein
MSRGREGETEVYRTTRAVPGAPGLDVRYRTGDPLGTAAHGSLEEFLVERYVLHTVTDGEIRSVRVRHPPYPLRAVAVESLSEGLLAAAGLARPSEPPLAHFSDGVNVEVLRVLRPASRGAPA